jgi:hypothetical protein
MADSAALRSRRSRAHAAGDHYLCRAGCAARSGAVAVPAYGDAAAGPRAALERLAARLEAASVADPGNALVARELRMTLVALSAPDDDAGLDYG